MKKILLLTMLCIHALNGIETISKSQLANKDQAYRTLLGKVKKLEGNAEIYVGAGTSAAGEPIFFGFEKLTNESAKNWTIYARALYDTPGILKNLRYININCQDQAQREDIKEMAGEYALELMDTMCRNRKKFQDLLGNDGISGGINGFLTMLARQRLGEPVYAAYASSQPITGPFGPQQEIPQSPTIEEFDKAYPNIIICIGMDMGLSDQTSEHRGIFKNPFNEIRDQYKNIAMKLHGWAGTVEQNVFHKTYIMIFPNPLAQTLLYRSIKPGDMYIGSDKCPAKYVEEEFIKKYPPIKDELLGTKYCRGSSGVAEDMHVFDLKVLSKYYTEK